MFHIVDFVVKMWKVAKTSHLIVSICKSFFCQNLFFLLILIKVYTEESQRVLSQIEPVSA